ncbi:hypothetical protein SETIT_5G368400v2 [Setaria italica]|uniref:Uncharacterized protein n=1 Tax=Setaria italica TaxID=4555 RepID=A0A368RCW2_SETIT|nr:hypothetical protein SETIT_5G368400v2 [Setaria italica]
MGWCRRSTTTAGSSSPWQRPGAAAWRRFEHRRHVSGGLRGRATPSRCATLARPALRLLRPLYSMGASAAASPTSFATATLASRGDGTTVGLGLPGGRPLYPMVVVAAALVGLPGAPRWAAPCGRRGLRGGLPGRPNRSGYRASCRPWERRRAPRTGPALLFPALRSSPTFVGLVATAGRRGLRALGVGRILLSPAATRAIRHRSPTGLFPSRSFTSPSPP